MQPVFPRSFFERSSLKVARELIGATLVRRNQGQVMAGTIVETEAYEGEEDLACHARAGRTPRTQIMYGPGGFAYVYFTYGAHWLLNAVTEPAGQPSAVLIRAIVPIQGLQEMALNRPVPIGKPRREGNLRPEGSYPGWTDGPAKLCQALAVDGRLNGIDLCDLHGELFLQPGETIPDERVTTGPRIGISNVPEPWRSIPWRFLAAPDDPGLRQALENQ